MNATVKMQEEIAQLHETQPVDDKGRVAVKAMSDTEMLREVLTILRGFQDGVDELAPALDGLKDNPMLKALGF